jgi:hypothetical protein
MNVVRVVGMSDNALGPCRSATEQDLSPRLAILITYWKVTGPILYVRKYTVGLIIIWIFQNIMNPRIIVLSSLDPTGRTGLR